jgi:hypothetical protein
MLGAICASLRPASGPAQRPIGNPARIAGLIVVVYLVLNVPSAMRHSMPNTRNVLPRAVNRVAGGQSERNKTWQCE